MPPRASHGGGNLKNSKQVADLAEPLNRTNAEEGSLILYAAWNVDDALDGFHADNYPRGENAPALREMQNTLYTSRGIFRTLAVVTILFAFFEPPLWCDNKIDEFVRIPLSERCKLPNGGTPIDSYFHFLMLPPFWSIVVEFLMLGVMMGCVLQEKFMEDAFEKAGVSGPRHKGYNYGHWAQVTFIMLVDVIVYYFVRQQNFRIAPYGRFALAFSCANVRQVFRSAYNCIDEFANVAVFMAGTVLFFAWFVTMVLDDIRDHRGHSALSEIGGDNFGSFTAAIYSLFVIMTGAAFPDDIDDVIKNIRWFSLVFYLFMLLGFFLFTQLLLAVVYSAYQGNVKEELTTFWKKRTRALGDAFLAIAEKGQDGNKVVKVDKFEKLIAKLITFPRLKGVLKKENTQIIFEALDDDGSNELSVSEFFDACYILQLTIWTTTKDSMFKKKFGLEGLTEFVENDKKLERCMTVLLLVNALFVFVESYYDINNMLQPDWFAHAELFFSFAYMGEVIAKLLVFSWANYWAYGENKFDFIVSVLLFVIGICTIFNPFGGVSHDLLRYLNLFRIMRMMKLLMQVERFQKMIDCIVKLILIAKDICALMALTLFFFAVLGMMMFGGLLYAENPVLVGSDYVTTGYDVLNFNDLWGSFETLFTMMVCNYMPEYTDAMTKVSKVPYAGGLYQGAYFFVGVSIVFNIFTAFTIDLFVELQDDQGDDDDDDEAAKGEEEGKAENGDTKDDGSSDGGEDEADEDEKDEDRNLKKMREKLEKQGKVLHISEPVQVMKMRTQTRLLDGLMDEVKKLQDSIAPRQDRPKLVA